MLDLILCHQTADFDALGAAVGLTRLKVGSKIVLAGGAHPGVRNFLALHRYELALIERRSVNPQEIRSLTIVDTQKRDRVGKTSQWLDLPQLEAIEVYDHHLDAETDIPATHTYIEPVGATTTLIVEQLQQHQIQLTLWEATVMALGIHVDTGSLTFDQTTPRDVRALAWLMEAGASLPSIREYSDQSLSPQLQVLLTTALEKLETSRIEGYVVGWVVLETEKFVPGLSGLTMRVLDLTEVNALFLVHQYYRREGGEKHFAIIGRSRIPQTNLNTIFTPLGGGGHSQAASATIQGITAEQILEELVAQLEAQIPLSLTARDLMSSPVRTIRPNTTIGEAQRILLRYGHSGLSVVNKADELVGIISRRDLDIALHHGFARAPVKGYMSQNLKTITPETPLPEIESLMVTYDVGRLPVLEEGQLVGIVTRTDVLRQRHPEGATPSQNGKLEPSESISIQTLKTAIPQAIWQFLERSAIASQARGWHLYVVGGAVRDLLLAQGGRAANGRSFLQDIDLVVDGFHNAADAGAGVELAKALQQEYPQARLEVHGAFQTAALLWHKDPILHSLAVDIATARTEFYPYPAANPEVEASSIRQDLYRRDFTINALALRLTAPHKGELLDFFGGILDLKSRQVRVLHANSFIEDPTRIYRAVRFAVRLGFTLEPQTEQYIRYAIESGVYDRLRLTHDKAPALTTRLKSELKYILETHYWKPALQLLSSLGALRCLHPQLKLTPQLWWQVRFLDRCLQRFDPNRRMIHWEMRLEALIASLPSEERAPVATHLQLSGETIERLKQLEKNRQRIAQSLSTDLRPSKIVMALRAYKLPTLVLLALKGSRTVRQQIWQYLTCWSQISAPLDGNDLKSLGYNPGPQFKEMLDALLWAKLDGAIADRSDAEVFLQKHYPVSQ
ncbi:CBS domain-containing protein [Lusitaniella coriacea]|uniref:CBS domain-containing protein n=1 Tax=Lusitaniella coriacea TaxID=1983105 RepID=UPI003CEB8334